MVIRPGLREIAGDIVFASAFPDAEVSRRVNSLVTRIEAKHHLAKRDKVPAAFRFWFDVQQNVIRLIQKNRKSKIRNPKSANRPAAPEPATRHRPSAVSYRVVVNESIDRAVELPSATTVRPAVGGMIIAPHVGYICGRPAAMFRSLLWALRHISSHCL